MGDSTCREWDLSTGLCTQTFTGHSQYLHSVKLRPETFSLFTASEDGSVRIWGIYY
jgi:WD40 repeat protein